MSAVQEREGRIMANAHLTSAVQCSALTVGTKAPVTAKERR